MATPLKDLPPRTLVGERYELRDPIGDGGMGTVYAAVDTRTGQDVAVKVLTLQEGRQKVRDEIKQRFLREVLAISRISHKHVVKVLDWGVIEDGDRPYMVMEYLHGKDLAAFLAEKPEPLSPDYVVDMMLELCSAVRAAHERSIIHRDLKTKNIFLARTEALHGWEVKLLDFGVAKGGFSELAELTHHGEHVGTYHYMAPEQLEGRASKETDQYAIGVLLYYCLTRKLPYRKLPTPQLLKAIEKGEFVPPIAHRHDLSPELNAIVVKAMSKHEKDRFRDVYELGQRLYAHASPFGKAAWKNLYTHSPVPPKMPAQLTSSIPTALLQRLEGRTVDDEARTEIANYAHFQGPTSPNPHGEGLSPSMADLMAPTKDPIPGTEGDSVSIPRQRDLSEYIHVDDSRHEGRAATDGISDVSIAVAEEGASEARPTTADGPLEMSGAQRHGWRSWAMQHRVRLATGGAAAAAVALVLVLVLHRPEEHLIRPARVPLPPVAAQSAAVPAAALGGPAPAAAAAPSAPPAAPAEAPKARPAAPASAEP